MDKRDVEDANAWQPHVNFLDGVALFHVHFLISDLILIEMVLIVSNDAPNVSTVIHEPIDGQTGR